MVESCARDLENYREFGWVDDNILPFLSSNFVNIVFSLFRLAF